MLDSGIININKPEGMTSFDVVAKLKRKLHIKRVGNTGTLDPMATGVLPICFGKATRIIEYYDGDLKTYIADMKLGIVTDTLDITGEVIETSVVPEIGREELEDAFGRYRGWIIQVPPKYSALKVNGKRLYEYAREGKDVEIKDRDAYIDDIRVLAYDEAEKTVRFQVTCGKGTYIRSICDDVGRDLGCGGTMTSLVRTRSGVFTIEDSYELADVLAMDESELESIVVNMDTTLVNLGIAVISDDRIKPYLNGMSTGIRRARVEKTPNEELECARAEWFGKLYRVYDREGNFLGVSELDQRGELVPSKIIGQ